jgi:hypothetical protein
MHGEFREKSLSSPAVAAHSRQIAVDFARAGAHLLGFTRLEDAVRNYVISYLDAADRYR